MNIVNRAASFVLLTILAAAPCAADTPGAAPVTAAQSASTEQMHRLFDDYWETRLRESPIYATFVGDVRYNDRLDDLSPAGIMRRRQENVDFLKRLEAIDSGALSESDKVSRDVLRYTLLRSIEAARIVGDTQVELGPWFGSAGLVSQMAGPQFTLPLLAASTRFVAAADYDKYLIRLGAIPSYLTQLTEELEAELKAGWTPSRIALRNVPSQFAAISDPDSAVNPMFAPFKSMSPELSETDRARIRQAGEQTIREIVAPAFDRFRSFFQTRYLPGAREGISASQLPGGPAYYALALQMNTTTSLSPREIHELGLKEVTRIEAAMQTVQKRAGFAGNRTEFVKYLWSDPKFFVATPAEMLTAYRDIAKRIDPQLPTLFRELPRLPYGIRAMPKEEGDNAEHYIPGASDGSRAGYFEANTNNLRHIARWQMTDLVLHEAVPGHHLQGARAQEIKDLPDFRRNIWFPAYGEGWALYAESLGDLIGMYEDPLDKYGQLSAEVWRAARLVVDSGMHAMGWSRERAIQFMRDHTSESEDTIVAEIDRYIVWPGQATAYKIGQLRIEALCDKAKAALGDRFDLRAFNNAVIDEGAMPLEVLDAVMARWIDRQKAAKAESASHKQ